MVNKESCRKICGVWVRWSPVIRLKTRVLAFLRISYRTIFLLFMYSSPLERRPFYVRLPRLYWTDYWTEWVINLLGVQYHQSSHSVGRNRCQMLWSSMKIWQIKYSLVPYMNMRRLYLGHFQLKYSADCQEYLILFKFWWVVIFFFYSFTV